MEWAGEAQRSLDTARPEARQAPACVDFDNSRRPLHIGRHRSVWIRPDHMFAGPPHRSPRGRASLYRRWLMATGIRQRLGGLAGCVLAAAVLSAPPDAAAQNGGISGRVTDQTTGTGLEAARIILTGTTRIATSNRDGQYAFRGVPAGTYQLRVLRVGYRPEVQSATVAEAQTVTLDFSMTPAPVQLDELVTTATGEQRKLEIANAVSTIDVAAVAKLPADHRVHQPDLRPGRGRPGAQERGHDRQRHPDPHPRLQQRFTLQRAAVLHRRDPLGERLPLDHAGHRRVRLGDRGRSVAHQRPQPGRHRQYRDREGPGRGHALRHSGVQRRGPDHHQARRAPDRPAGTCSARSARSGTTTPIRSTTMGATRTTPTSMGSAPCSSSSTATARRPRSTSTPPCRTRPPARSRPASGSSTG